MDNNHDDVVVIKPWGYEYLAYKNNDVAIWFLHIDQHKTTSMHCHTQKTTGLLLLNGIAKLNFLADSKIIEGPHKQMIRRGLFHQTEAISDNGINLLEIETPIDKNDLVRLKDSYGRSEKGYEKDTFPKSDSHVWFKEGGRYAIGERTLTVETPSHIDFIDDKDENDILMFLSGGLYKSVEGRTFNIVIPGDIGYKKIVTQVRDHVDGLLDNTMVITIK